MPPLFTPGEKAPVQVGQEAGRCGVEIIVLALPRIRDRVPMKWILFSKLPNPSGRTMALRSTQPLKGMSTRSLKKPRG
jgi:hypothetical protein